MKFEAQIDRLEKIVDQMERGDLDLDESLKLFEEGVGLSRKLHKHLDEAEQKVKTLLAVDSEGEAKTEDFEAGDEQ